MNFLVVLLFVSVFTTGYLTERLHALPSIFVLVPEVLSGVALIIVLGRLVGGRRLEFGRPYAVFFAMFFFVLLFGFLAEGVPTGPIVAGLRDYVKFIPFFLLPAVYPFTDKQLAVQLRWLMGILVLQMPLAVFQRFVQYGGSMHTGDPIRGSVTTSSSLSLLMVCGIALLVALYLRRKIGFKLLLVGMGVLVVPTTLNQTMATFVLLPIGLVVPALFMPSKRRSLRRMLPVAFIGAAALVAYVGIYDSLIQYRKNGMDIGTFYTSNYLEQHLYSGAADGDGKWVGRFDSVDLAWHNLSPRPLAFAFGLGAGNVSESKIPGFDGEYASFVDRYGVDVTQVSGFLWEIGAVGLLTYLFLFWISFRDARFLAKSTGPYAVYGQVWATIMVIMTVALMYKSVFSMNEIAYLFWFYTGVIARRAYVEKRSRAAPAPAAANVRAGHWEYELGPRSGVPQIN